MSPHVHVIRDRDRCGICYEKRVRKLHRAGLALPICQSLIRAGIAALPEVEVLETATPKQIALFNAEHADRFAARRRGDR